MQRYKIKIEYEGTSFVGWQFQKNGQSVQEVLQKAIFNFSEERESMIPFDTAVNAPIPSVTTPTDLQTPKNNVFIDYEFNTTEDMFFIKMAGS